MAEDSAQLPPARGSAAEPGSRSGSSLVRRLLAGMMMVVVIAIVIAAIFALQLVWARQHLLQGAHDLNAALVVVRSPQSLKNPVLRHAAVSELAAARREFSRARNDLFLWSPVLDRTGSLPLVGRQLQAASPAADAAYYATTSALDLVTGASGLWSLLQHRPAGSKLLPRLASALAPGRGSFESASRAGAEAGSALGGMPDHSGNYTLDQATVKLRSNLPRLRAAAAWLGVLPEVLGTAGTTRYLFCWENSREIRPAGGFLGAADLVTVKNGRLRKHFTGSALNHELDFQHLPLQEAALTDETDWLFRDSNISPDFPISARLERWFYGHDTGTTPQGVIDFVDQSVPDLLTATGPIYLKAYHVWLTPANAVTLADRYAGANAFRHGPLKPGRNLDTYRKQFLGFEFNALVHRLLDLPVRRWGLLATAMSFAVARHDILIYDVRASVERAIEASGASAALTAPRGDALSIVDDNRSYNKIAPYVSERASYRATILPNGWISSQVVIRYHLSASPSSLEGQGPYFGHRGSKHDFLDFVRILAPAGAVVQSFTGVKFVMGPSGQPAYGMTQFGGYFLLKPNRGETVRLRYDEPPSVLAAADFRSYRLTVFRQPGATLSAVRVTVKAGSGLFLKGQRGSTRLFTSNYPLGQDLNVSVGVGGRLHPVSVPVDHAYAPDPLIPWSAFGRAAPSLAGH